MSSSDRPINLDDAYSVSGPEENRELYARWASSYEETFIEAEGYRYHERVAQMFVERGGEGPVLDVGCGTGVVGLELNRLGVSAIDGVDISKAMLDEARQKRVGSSQVYRNLREADLTGSLAIDSGSYRGIVSVGTFTHGHLGPASFDELIRVAVPGALCVIGINSAHYVNLGFEDRLDFLVNDGQIGQYELVPTPIYDASDLDDPDRVSNVMVWVVS